MHIYTAAERTALVAECTAAAVHRRDHHHPASSPCHPHVVEVVRLGHHAVAVCHDCESDSGFLPRHDAEALAQNHRTQTLGDNSPPLCPAA